MLAAFESCLVECPVDTVMLPGIVTVLPTIIVSAVEYIEFRRVGRIWPADEYVVDDDRIEPIREICFWNQFLRLSTTGVSTLSYKQDTDT